MSHDLFEKQHSDSENAKGPMKVTNRSETTKRSSRGMLNKIADEDNIGQQHLSGKGGVVVTTRVPAGK